MYDSLQLAPTGTLSCPGRVDNFVRVWERRGGGWVATATVQQSDFVCSVALAKNKKTIALWIIFPGKHQHSAEHRW